MKTKLALLFTAVFFLMNICAEAQKIEPKKKVEEKTTKRVDKKIDKGIDKGLDKLEEGLGGLFGKKKKKKKNKNNAQNQAQQNNEQTGNAQAQASEAEATPVLNWAKYDFVPGDKVIFEDTQENEENGEFPSRWDLEKGIIENAEFGGENVIMFRGGSPTIIPYLRNSNTDYLPEVFTVEFDLFLPSNVFKVYFYDRKNQEKPRGANSLDIWTTYMNVHPARSDLPGGKNIANKWSHISIAYTSGKLKAYIDDTRLINIPHLDFDPTGISFHVYHAKDDNRCYIKNIRIAEDGVKYYDRFLQDGKIIANGIRFDVNKATLRPESMGVINEIAELMKDHAEIKFSVEGHTDSDGEDASNQILSEQRAATVVATLEKLGIDSTRLTSKGWGESNPMDTNDTPEGKANNRRVEFVNK